MAYCRECDKSISGDEMGLNLKLIDRNVTEYLCVSCMSKKFSCDEAILKEKIRHYKKIGCKLFPSESVSE